MADTQPATLQTATAQVAVPAPPAHTARVMHVNYFFDGVILTLAMIAALLFIRSYRKSRDRYFLFFAAAFAIYGINRILFQFYINAPEDTKSWLYAMRLISFSLIIAAIIDKNLRRQDTGFPITPKQNP